ncbi:deaminase [Streptomyces sp. NPDC087659]|uniref:deaminase n=1 Tax=Streptomyces sp. NPDC087659 TaxID=3365801 RepID=UPI0038072F4C
MSLIDLAIRQAARSRCRYRVGAVLASGNRVLAASPNRRRNNPRVDFLHATFHAEEAVLRRTARTDRSTIYIARVNSLGHPALAKPCPRCLQALVKAGVSRVYYTTDANVVDNFRLPAA